MKSLAWMMAAALLLVSGLACDDSGSTRRAMENLKPDGKKVVVRVEHASRAKVGEPVSFKVTSNTAGKLWVFEVDPKDRLNMVFPNRMQKDNAIAANQALALPAPGSGWQITASPPLGKSLTVFVVTQKGVDLKQVLGKPLVKDKALVVAESAPSWGVAKAVILVEKGE